MKKTNNISAETLDFIGFQRKNEKSQEKNETSSNESQENGI